MSEVEREILIAVMSTSAIIVLLMAAFVFFLYTSQKRIREKQQEMFDAVLTAQQMEQERIARDLHDQIGPLLSIIKSQIDCIDDNHLSEEDRTIKNEVHDQLGIAVNEIRSIAHNLIPNTFSEYGFLKSIEYYIVRLKEYNNIDVTFKSSVWPNHVQRNYEMSLFRILLELFQNTLKHSQASKIVLDLNLNNDKLSIMYSDNGIGIDTTHLTKKGIGLRNIDTRVQFLKGNYEVESEKNISTTYHFSFDMKNLYGKK